MVQGAHHDHITNHLEIIVFNGSSLFSPCCLIATMLAMCPRKKLSSRGGGGGGGGEGMTQQLIMPTLQKMHIRQDVYNSLPVHWGGWNVRVLPMDIGYIQ